MGPRRVWVTRARPGADATAARLRARGWEPWVAPLLEVRPSEDAPVGLDAAAALAFTSANGVDAFAGRSARRDLPVFAVGDATAEAASRQGFTQVRSAAGDLRALADLVARSRPAGPVLWIRPREPAGDLAALLAPAGLGVRSAVLYETVPLPAPTLDPAPAAVLLHSPKAAQALAAAFPPLAGATRLLCLSEAVAAPLAGVHPHVETAQRPDEASLLALLGNPPPPS